MPSDVQSVGPPERAKRIERHSAGEWLTLDEVSACREPRSGVQGCRLGRGVKHR
jgi:hypothetical protein